MRDAAASQLDEVRKGPVPGVEPDAASARPILSLRQTTLDLPPREQFVAWRDANAGLVDYRQPASPPDAYPVSAETWRFGGLALLAAETPAGAYRRSAACLRRDGIDLWSFSMATHGQRVYRTRDEITLMQPGRVFLHSLGQPFEAARTRSGWLHLYVPRGAIPDIAGATPSGCRVLDTPGELLLRDLMLLLAADLPRMSAADGERIAEATRAMMALAVAPSANRREAAAAPIAAVQMSRLRDIIRANLGSARLGPDRLCRMAGVSRSQLYRLFEPEGGVARVIQRERLNAAHRALCDPADDRGVAEIAEAVGLFDPSSFSRMFRRTFGLSPRDLRMMRSLGTLPVRRGQGAADGTADTASALLRTI